MVKNYGNPLRKEFFDHAPVPQKTDSFSILTFGGSLGSQEINQLIFDLIKHYHLEIKISILHQIGQNSPPPAPSHPRIDYRRVNYLDDIAKEYQKADFIICRGGAMTISELKFVQRPALIIPIRFHKDLHQVHNAKSLKSEAHFPVYVESASALSDEGCDKLQYLIKTEYFKYEERVKNKMQNRSQQTIKEQENPSSLIAREVLQNV
ncbi:MAG: UDP-N-acetylglucosamine--N-acetylmuramyl-(pentapeptide) pyrophosphoryl-undecaprenol N-acetylglucosamine transferase [Bacteriovoracales bacterium]|nr:UDP-N-acetylglucosamine--N-acetylmuramyl-(pentapeptide) pyrophosphoryl-undecaprenol N-acetylglucosamine transferase [Bacteriovoracales bacterium]